VTWPLIFNLKDMLWLSLERGVLTHRIIPEAIRLPPVHHHLTTVMWPMTLVLVNVDPSVTSKSPQYTTLIIASSCLVFMIHHWSCQDPTHTLTDNDLICLRISRTESFMNA
jgi:hypothetical protein